MAYLFREIYSKLFKLSPPLNRKYRKFLSAAKPRNSTQLICAHIRTGSLDKEIFIQKENFQLILDFISI